MVKQRKASEIYRIQNRVLHRVFEALGLPYDLEKDYWLSVIREVCGREVSGLSELTLGERDLLIKHLQRANPHLRIYNPPVPKRLRNWLKGEEDKGYAFREERDQVVRKILALWVELGYEPGQLRKVVRNMFKVDDVRWLKPEQADRLLRMLIARARKKGVYHYARG